MKRRSEAGQALVTAAIALTVLLLAAGLAIDMGYLRYQKRRMQAAADSAALAGASELAYPTYDGYNYGAVQQAAVNDAKTSGFDSSAPGVSVIAQKPLTGPFAGQNGYVEVLIEQDQPTFFMKIAHVNSVSVSARAVAHLGNGRNCMYALGLNDPNALFVNGANILASTCGIVSNGDFTASGGATVEALSVGVVGASSTAGATVVPIPKTSVPASDPLASLQRPTPSGCVPFVGTPVPGTTYCGISIAAGNVTFPSGLYMIAGDFRVSGTASIAGIGVTFFITKGPGGPGAVAFTSSGGTDLQAPTTSGPYEGILMMRDSTDLNPPPSTFLTAGGQELEGVLYFPTATLTLGANTNNYSIVVANEILMQGGFGIFNMHTNYSVDGSPIKGAALAE
jgi:hypothetical protein